MIETFESLVDNHQGLVVSVASNIYKRIPRHIPYEDVLSYGQLGLTQAARSYRPQEGSVFATFAYYRISGAIYDGLTRMNWTSRSEYRLVKSNQLASQIMEESGPADTDENRARWLADSVTSLSMVYFFSKNETGDEGDFEPVDRSPGPDEEVSRRELAEVMKKALRRLEGDDRELIRMVYYDDLSQADAAEKLGKSRSWACRAHGKILKRLAGFLAVT